MSAPTVEDLKKAIAQLPNDDRLTLATWLNLSVIREELFAADEQISRREGSEYDEIKLPELFRETEADALQLLRQKVARTAKKKKHGIKWVTVPGGPPKDSDLGNREHLMERLLRNRTAL
jgi:hypothetical protein